VVEEDEPEEVVVYCPTALSGSSKPTMAENNTANTLSLGSVPFGLAHMGLLLV
jgi:hypothetical protein